MKEKLHHCNVWTGDYKGVTLKIKNWASFSTSYSSSWAYYVLITEKRCPKFEEIWLKDEIFKITPSSVERISHNYYSSILGNVKMHGGITYYQKHGQVPGHRWVEIGCDYQHYHDEGQEYSKEDLYLDALETIDNLFELGIVV
jgi:hypothetical protein